ncbi:MAG TPA: hypothetical protein VE398_02685, partial [Acidobacteriota bacterium]|nr:hypothetical protein [Acidobacteriota bacterium]
IGVLTLSAWLGVADGGVVTERHFGSGNGPPPTAAAKEIWDAWLRYHETEVCQTLDAYFVFRKSDVEVWCRVEDEKAYQRFSDLIAPLRARSEIEIYPTHPPAIKKSSEEKGPPPSLWNNSELRAYLGDPFSRNSTQGDTEVPRPASARGTENDYLLKQRMMMFADQTLDWARKMERYGEDIPALAEAAFSSAAPAEFRQRARAVCLSHTQAVGKYADRLAESLSEALPKGNRKSPDAGTKKQEPSASTPRDAAIKIADSAVSNARRVRRFIYPIHHTVELSDLRDPSLLDSLKQLQKLASSVPHIR